MRIARSVSPRRRNRLPSAKCSSTVWESTGLALEARDFATLTEDHADHRQHAEDGPGGEECQQDNDQRRLPGVIENETQGRRFGVADGEHQQDREDDEPNGPGQGCHDVRIHAGYRHRRGR
jgi:hypothetical protein